MIARLLAAVSAAVVVALLSLRRFAESFDAHLADWGDV